MYDKNGNLIHNEKIKNDGKDEESESKTVKIDPEMDIPKGRLINQFIFSDNSKKSI
ncbi:MAG: hypothetical protein U9Q98_09725 [Bacteroidota bacterium]|nr:hypothetical protein [Bacteroidota bacterium]